MISSVELEPKKNTVFVPAPWIGGDAATDEIADETGARALHRTLNDAIGRAAPAPDARQPGPKAPPSDAPPAELRAWRIHLRRGAKIAAALTVVVVFGARPLQNLLQASSVEAVINARVVTLRAPIDGYVVAAPGDFTAWSAIKGAPVLRIRNDDADRARLDELHRQVGRLDDERPGVVQRLDNARDTLRRLEAQVAAFTQARIRQLESRCAALESDAASTSAKADEAQAAYERIATLAARGVSTNAELARYNRDNLAAAAADKAAKERLQEARVELDTARTGSFLGDSYNDRPGSAQRADEVRQRVNDIAADLQARDAQRGRLAHDLAEETKRFNRQSETEITLPVSGRIWEIMVSPGERVRRDQDLIRVLDCATTVVSANVEESVYNQLRIGGPARFRPSDGGNDIDGVIVNLTGMAGATGNLGIAAQALQKQTYNVTVSVPAIAQAGSCQIGRTGRVFFDKGDAAVPALDFGLRR